MFILIHYLIQQHYNIYSYYGMPICEIVYENKILYPNLYLNAVTLFRISYWLIRYFEYSYIILWYFLNNVFDCSLVSTIAVKCTSTFDEFLHFHKPNNIIYYDLRRRPLSLDNIKYIFYYNIIRRRFLHTKT